MNQDRRDFIKTLPLVATALILSPDKKQVIDESGTAQDITIEDKYILRFLTSITYDEAEKLRAIFIRFLHDPTQQVIAISKDVEIFRL